jgi:large subunit ribosomal protein L21
MYAVVETSGHQFKIEEGETIRVDRMDGEEGQQVTFDRVLLLRGDDVAVGTPTVAGAKVLCTIVRHGKAPKVTVYKFKRRSGYHKKQGFRAQYTDVRIDKIES